MVFLSVCVLGGVSGFVVLSWASVGMDWLSVGVLVNIHDWVVVLIMGMVRVTSWVGVDSLVIVVDGLVVDWLNLVGSVALEIVSDFLMWRSHIICCHVVVMVIIYVVSTMMTVIVVNILKLNLMVVFAVLVGTVVNFVFSLMVDKLMGNFVMLSLASLNLWLNLVNGSLLKWPVIRVVIWDVNSSQNSMFVVVRWSIIVLVVIVVVKLWMSLMVDVVLNIWFFMVVHVGHDWLVMLNMVCILMMQVMVIVMLIMVLIVVVLVLMVRSFVMSHMFNVVVNWLVVDNFVVHLVMDWLNVVYLVMDWLNVVRSFMVIFLMVHINVNWGIVHIVSFSVVNWPMCIGVVNIVHMAWLNVMLMASPLIVMTTWVVLYMVVNFMMIVVSPGIVVCWFTMVVTVDIMVISPSIKVFIMFVLMVVIMVPGEITVVMVWNIPVPNIVVMLVNLMMVDMMWLSVNSGMDFVLMEIVWAYIMLVVIVVVKLWVGLMVSFITHMMWLLVMMSRMSHMWDIMRRSMVSVLVMEIMMVIMFVMVSIMVVIRVGGIAVVVVMLDDMISRVIIMCIPVCMLGVMVLNGVWVEETVVFSMLMGAVSHIVVWFNVNWCMNRYMNWSVFWSMWNWVCYWMWVFIMVWSSMCGSMSRMKWESMSWRSVHWCMRCNSVCNGMWSVVCNWVSCCMHIMAISKVGLNTVGILMRMVSWVSMMILGGVVVSMVRCVVSIMSMSVIMTSVPFVMAVRDIVSMCCMQIVTVWVMVVGMMVVIVVVHWLHFQDEVTARCINI